MRENIAISREIEPRRWVLLRFLLFVFTFLAPVTFFSLISGRVVWPLFLLFPVGLFYFPKSPFLFPGLVLGWSLYITVTILATRSKTPRVFVVMYLLLIGLVAFNLKG